MPRNLDKQHPTGGFVLVTVLWVLAILTVIALGLGNRSVMERRVSWNAMDHAQALHMARGAVERGIFEVGNKRQIDFMLDQSGYTALDQRWTKPLDLLNNPEED